MRHVISIHDVVSDTMHQFAPSYHDYVLYSNGGTKEAPKKVCTAFRKWVMKQSCKHNGGATTPCVFCCSRSERSTESGFTVGMLPGLDRGGYSVSECLTGGQMERPTASMPVAAMPFFPTKLLPGNGGYWQICRQPCATVDHKTTARQIT